MEVETGGTGSKRRKSAPAEARASDPAAKQDEGGADRISDLPDDILGEIISLLPTGDGARTQILSPRWRHLWRSANLCDVRAVAVTQILSSHTAPVRRFCVPAHHILGVPQATSDLWLRSPGLDKLQELEFIYTPNHLYDLLPPPASTFRFSATLLAFTLGQGRLPVDITRALSFPLLKRLTLQCVTISDCSLHSFISGCPALECLLLDDSSGFRSLKINSCTLRSISINVFEFRELVIENAPCLRRLLGLNYFAYGPHVSVVSAPKLEALGCVLSRDFTSTKFVFGSSVMQVLPVDSLTRARCTIKILGVHLLPLSLDPIIEFLTFFPCLENLYVVSDYLGPRNVWDNKHQNLITSLDIRLKTIVLDSYRGKKSEVNFVTFFVLNAKVLKFMTLTVPDRSYKEEFLELQRRQLQLENIASRGAQIHFITKSDSRIRNVVNRKDVHDLDMRNPFIC